MLVIEIFDGLWGRRRGRGGGLPMSSQGQVLSKMSGSTSLERWIVGWVVPPRVVALRAGSVGSVWSARGERLMPLTSVSWCG